MLKLKKNKGCFIITRTNEDFDDTYNEVHLDEDEKAFSCFHLEDLKKEFDSMTIPESHWMTPELSKYLKLVNIFAERVEVPNKKIETDRDGSSKLIRHPKDGSIEIAYRAKRKDGTQERFAKSPNTCYISNEDRERFFSDVKNYGSVISGRFGSRYLLMPKDSRYSNWSNFMDTEYERLSGISVRQKRKQTKITWETTREGEYYRDFKQLISNLFSYVPVSFEVKVFSEAAQKKICKIDDSGRAIYDKDGIFLQLLSHPFTVESMDKMISKLTVDELRDFKLIINQYI